MLPGRTSAGVASGETIPLKDELGNGFYNTALGKGRSKLFRTHFDELQLQKSALLR